MKRTFPISLIVIVLLIVGCVEENGEEDKQDNHLWEYIYEGSHISIDFITENISADRVNDILRKENISSSSSPIFSGYDIIFNNSTICKDCNMENTWMNFDFLNDTHLRFYIYYYTPEQFTYVSSTDEDSFKKMKNISDEEIEIIQVFADEIISIFSEIEDIEYQSIKYGILQDEEWGD